MKKNKRTSHNPRINAASIVFTMLCVVSLVFIPTPLLIRFEWLRRLFSSFLSPLRSAEYKGIYIATSGAILGSFLAIFGAIWTQNYIEKKEQKKQIQKSAFITYSDLRDAFETIIPLMTVLVPSAKNLGFDASKKLSEIKLVSFYAINTNGKHIFYDKTWRENVMILKETLSAEDFRNIQIMYSMLEIIALSINSLSHVATEAEDDKAYELMHQLVDVHGFESGNEPLKAKPLFIKAIDSVKALCEMEKVK